MGGLHRLRSKRSGEPGSEKNLLREEAAQRRGNCFRWKVAAMKPKAQPCPRQDSRQAKDAGAARSCKETWPTSASEHDGRSEERRVGKEGVSTGRSRGSRGH